MNENIWANEKIIEVLKNGGVVVMPTDTIYGMLTLAENSVAVENLYKIRQRRPDKPFIILIGDISEIKKFEINLSDLEKNELKKYWLESDRPTSVILDCINDTFEYLHRGTKSLAFRLPKSEILRKLLLKTGPLVAPSANLEEEPPSKSIKDAKKYFGDAVDLYIDGGVLVQKASRIIKLQKDGSVTIIRE